MAEKHIDITILQNLNKTLKKNLAEDLATVNILLDRMKSWKKRIAQILGE